MSRIIQIEEPQNKPVPFSIFSYGFRPFFLAAGIYAILPLIPWVLYLTGTFDPNIPLQHWHAHEMLFGFVAAGINGFLLTALPNWTGTPPLTGTGLKRIFYFWLIGRIAFWLFLFIDHPLIGYVLFLDLLLPIAQSIRITRIVTATQNKRNFIFIGILSMLAIANLLIILDLNKLTEGTAQMGALFAVNIIMITIAVVGGRVTPNFTRSYLQQKGIAEEIRSFPMIEKLAIGLLILNALTDLIVPHSMISYSIALLACGVHAFRFSHWQMYKILHYPLLWVLHAGYLWLILTLFLKGSESLLGLPYHLYVHAFTVGAIGLYMLGIMTRATLGHTGRPLSIGPSIIIVYLLIFVAAILRTVAPFFPEHYTEAMVSTMLLWTVAFALYLYVYAPILTRPRVDGKPG